MFLLSIISYLGAFFNKKQLLSVTGLELLTVIAKYAATHSSVHFLHFPFGGHSATVSVLTLPVL